MKRMFPGAFCGRLWACMVFAFLPCGLYAQESTMLLDANLASGYQGATEVETVQAGQRVGVEVFGRYVAGVSAFEAELEFDASKLVFDGFSADNSIPGFTGLKVEPGVGSVIIGGASVTGSMGPTHHRLGVVYFRALEGFSGSASVLIDNAKLSAAGALQVIAVASQVAVGAVSDTPVLLDADVSSGYQAGRSAVDAKAGDVVSVEVYGRELDGASGFTATLQYDPAKLSFTGFSEAGLISGFTGLQVTPQSGTVEVGGASVTGVANASVGRLGVVQFAIRPGFSGDTEIRFVQGRLVVGGIENAFQSSVAIVVSALPGAGFAEDFNGNGTVDFPDFLQFAAAFGKGPSDPAFDAAFDLDGSGTVDFPDFLQFAAAFGK